LLGYDLYDRSLYAATRQRILSNSTNPFFFVGKELHGLGSPHTEPDFVWPLATAVEALTTSNTTRQLELLQMLLKMAAGNGLVHESVHVDYTTRFSRAEFGWANAMTVVMLERLLGVDCDMEAERFRLSAVAKREQHDAQFPPNGDDDRPHYYEQLEAGIIHVSTKGPEVEVEAPSWQQLIDPAVQQAQQEELMKQVLALSAVEQDVGTPAPVVVQAAAPGAQLQPPQQLVVQQQQPEQQDASGQSLSTEEIEAGLQLAAQQRGMSVQQLVLEEYAKALQDA
jgi:hypothetical protein